MMSRGVSAKPLHRTIVSDVEVVDGERIALQLAMTIQESASNRLQIWNSSCQVIVVQVQVKQPTQSPKFWRDRAC